MKIIFATQNKGKLKEVNKIFQGTSFEIISLADIGFTEEIEETGTTFEENALLKAKYIYSRYKTPTLADDSGLMVDQLNGMPGIYSARFAGENCTYEDNMRKLLNILEEYPEPHLARFVCCAVYVDEKYKFLEYGYLEGKIIRTAKGNNGFGYDPIFQPFELGSAHTLAELSLESKNLISHRRKAFEKLKNNLMKLYA